MPNMYKLSPEIEHDLESRLKSGNYQSADELLREALAALDERDALEAELLDAIKGERRIEVGPGYWEEKKRLLAERHKSSGK